MNDTITGLITGVVIGLSLATIGWTLYVKHIECDAVNHGVGIYTTDRYGSTPTFRWAAPKIILNGK